MGKKIRQARQSWATLKEQFIQRRLAGQPISLAAFARERSVDVRTMERHSARENWIGEIDARAQERLAVAREYAAKLVELNSFHLQMWRSGFQTR